MIDLKIYTDDPERLKARENTVRLQLRRPEIQRKLDAFNSALRPTENAQKARAEAVLRGKDVHEVDAAGIRESMAGLNRELEVLTTAIEMAKAEEREAESRASRKLSESLRAKYAALAKKRLQARIADMELAREEMEMRAAVEAAGATFLLPTAALPGVLAREYDRSDCREAYWCRHLIESGYITASDVPTHYRTAWNLGTVSPPVSATVTKIGRAS